MKTYLYLLAYGRSGSTLLDWHLDSHPGILGLGEVGRLPDGFGTSGALPKFCACGSSLRDCQFWRPVLEAGSTGRSTSVGFEEWNRFLIGSVLPNKPDASVVLDSSGHLARLERLLSSGLRDEYDLKVLYLTRDARGVVHSASVRGYNKGQFRPSVLRASVSWWYRNTRAQRFFNSLPAHSKHRVTYEELCTEPSSVLKGIQRFLGVEELGVIDRWRTIVHHTFAGNVRLRESASSEITADLSWIRGLSPVQMCIVECLTGSLNRKLMSKKSSE